MKIHCAESENSVFVSSFLALNPEFKWITCLFPPGRLCTFCDAVVMKSHRRLIFALGWMQLKTRKLVGFMQSWNCTSHFKSHLLLISNFQMRLEMRCAIWNFLKLLKKDVLFETFEMRCAIWNLKLLKWDVLFETWNFWNEKCYLKLLKPIIGRI